MHPSFTDMRSRLWAHLRSLAPANRHRDLSPADYQQARYVCLVERCEFSGSHRHVGLDDIEQYGDVRLIDDVAAYLMTGDQQAKERGWQRLCDALSAAANVTIDNRLREIRALRMSGLPTSRACPPATLSPPREPSEHEADYREERLAERATAIEAGRDFVEELAVRS